MTDTQPTADTCTLCDDFQDCPACDGIGECVDGSTCSRCGGFKQILTDHCCICGNLIHEWNSYQCACPADAAMREAGAESAKIEE